MQECSGSQFILNGNLHRSELFDASLVYEGESVYEVLRIENGLPVFFDEHIERLRKSVRLQGREMIVSNDLLRESVLKLSPQHTRKKVNLKIVFNYGESGSVFLVYFIKASYPTFRQYRQGVRGVLFHAERERPESKIINQKLKTGITSMLIHEKAYEALLVNSENCITEGSRSNIFFISGTTLFTAPDREVLNGITRAHIIDICNENNIGISYKSVNSGEISDYNCAFMTGTSPVVLPFHHIGNVRFEVKHKLIPWLRDLCLKRARESTRRFQNKS